MKSTSTILSREESRQMTREEIKFEILRICRETFEFDDPGLDDDLRDVHGFDSIDAIELLREIEIMLGIKLTREEKEKAMFIRTINQILDYIESLDFPR
jgi:acyl carrier protein